MFSGKLSGVAGAGPDNAKCIVKVNNINDHSTGETVPLSS
jgi:hypothetical protein